MRRILIGVVGAILLIGVGVGGTLGAQHLSDDDPQPSADCQKASQSIHEILNPTAGSGASVPDANTFNTLLDIKYKICHP